MELSPTRGWQKHVIGQSDKITIKPGEMVLCRTSERFSMPSDCAGMIEGRSSYSRLGLSVTAGGFVNPGWRGHMPLTIVNHSSVAIRVPVGTPLCQLLVIGLREAPEFDYAARGDRKYVNDQGGPSLWWRDAVMKSIRDKLSATQLDGRVFDELDELLDEAPDDDVASRIEDFIATQGSRRYGNADELLGAFAVIERRRKRIFRSVVDVGKAAWGVLVATLVTVVLAGSSVVWSVLLSVMTAASVLYFLWAVTVDVPDYLTPDHLRELQRRRDLRRTVATPSPT